MILDLVIKCISNVSKSELFVCIFQDCFDHTNWPILSFLCRAKEDGIQAPSRGHLYKAYQHRTDVTPWEPDTHRGPRENLERLARQAFQANDSQLACCPLAHPALWDPRSQLGAACQHLRPQGGSSVSWQTLYRCEISYYRAKVPTYPLISQLAADVQRRVSPAAGHSYLWFNGHLLVWWR